MRAIEVDDRQVRAWAGDRRGLLARLHRAASSDEDQHESREGPELPEELDHYRNYSKKAALSSIVDHRFGPSTFRSGKSLDVEGFKPRLEVKAQEITKRESNFESVSTAAAAQFLRAVLTSHYERVDWPSPTFIGA
jgi:hypothetical protein